MCVDAISMFLAVLHFQALIYKHENGKRTYML